MEDWRQGGFGLYLHWPYCVSKCPYCDFNSHVAAEVDPVRWQRAYLAEIARVAAETPGRVLDTIYFGGGTPSLMPPDLVAAVIAAARGAWAASNCLEITLEANPNSAEAAKFAAYADAGVNRLSLGVQALNDADLRRLGRAHDLAEALRALEIARATFPRLSFDLIYARQDQTPEDWRSELARALDLEPDHLSLYQLTVEEDTIFGRRHAAGRLTGLPDEDRAAEMYLATEQACDAAGIPAYEVSNYARSGQESRHNLVYWRGGDYAGIGPGAHGRLTLEGRRIATSTLLAPRAWLEAVERRGSGEAPRAVLSPDERAEEFLLMGLRLREGISIGRYHALAGRALPAAAVADLAELGMVSISGDRLAVTLAGRMVLNQVVRALAA
jgi:oxygen-independent coproporphyrinogen-3 oxidase